MMDWTKFNELSILIIDDDHLTRELIGTILKQVPTINIYQSVSGLEALEIISTIKIDMILLDLYMPQMNGREFIKEIQKSNKFKSIPIVLISTDRLSRVELSNIGVNYSLTKPFDFHNFLENIYMFMEQETTINAT